MKAKVTVRMDNAAFDDPGELARIFRVLANWIQEYPGVGTRTNDKNGNYVAELIYKGRRRQ